MTALEALEEAQGQIRAEQATRHNLADRAANENIHTAHLGIVSGLARAADIIEEIKKRLPKAA